jgi:hypothetical protein
VDSNPTAATRWPSVIGEHTGVGDEHSSFILLLSGPAVLPDTLVGDNSDTMHEHELWIAPPVMTTASCQGAGTGPNRRRGGECRADGVPRQPPQRVWQGSG